MGYPSVDEMTAEHDALHASLCEWLGLPSNSMKIARGEEVTEAERELSYYEEDAVLHVQRFRQMARRLA